MVLTENQESVGTDTTNKADPVVSLASLAPNNREVTTASRAFIAVVVGVNHVHSSNTRKARFVLLAPPKTEEEAHDDRAVVSSSPVP
jgi:hypothetical protein